MDRKTQNIVAIPFPGRGHINPLMNLCKLLVSRYHDITVTFVVTEEWSSLLSSTPKPPPTITIQTIPNVIPSELVRASVYLEFVRAVYTKMEAPVEQLLDRLGLHQISAIIADTIMPWTVELGNRKNIPVVSLWTQSPSVFSLYYHFDLVIQNRHYPADLSVWRNKGRDDRKRGLQFVLGYLGLGRFLSKAPGEIARRIASSTWLPSLPNRSLSSTPPLKSFSQIDVCFTFPSNLSERGDEVIDYIPGMSPTRLSDLPGTFSKLGKELMGALSETFSCIKKTQCVMFTSFDELECQTMNILKATLPFPVYSIGPLIPHPPQDSTPNGDVDNYFKWLDLQPADSVLYISLGSFLSVSTEQMTEIVQGVGESGVRFLWVARADTDASKIQEICGEMGLVVPWCDQLKVLCHSSVGGFWTHCGWNSTLEAVFAGVPMLTFPISFDQIHNRKLIVHEWGNGMNVKEVAAGNVVGRNAISMTVQRFMDLDGDESKEMRRKASLLKETCRQALSKDGSSAANLNAFARHISKSH